MNDKEVVQKFMTNNPDKSSMVEEYINGKIQTVEVAKQL